MSATIHKIHTRARDLVLQIKADNPNATRAEQAAIFLRMINGPYKHLTDQVVREMCTRYMREHAAEGKTNAIKLLARSRHKKRAARK